MALSYTGLFSGAGGLDLGFEMAGFRHAFSTDIDQWSIKTLEQNKPNWNSVEADIKEISPNELPDTEVLLAGFPCQGFSLGGNRQEGDERDYLFKEVVRLAKSRRPKFVIIENVLNLRTMKEPISGKTYVDLISHEFQELGYKVKHQIFKVSGYGVPQTRRRFIFIASLDDFPDSFHWPSPGIDTPASEYLRDIAINHCIVLPNHNPEWGFASGVHIETNAPYSPSEPLIPCRFSRTGSDGHPLRSLDAPFPAVDTATIWGWAQGNVVAERKEKDRVNGKYIRNRDTDLKLWRIEASRLRSFTDREYARLQTFPDDWIFCGGNKRHTHKQIGNAVPVQFSYRIAQFINDIHLAQESGRPMESSSKLNPSFQMELNF
jgi:DNA (cytosine-5)-methyltransferase 1